MGPGTCGDGGKGWSGGKRKPRPYTNSPLMKAILTGGPKEGFGDSMEPALITPPPAAGTEKTLVGGGGKWAKAVCSTATPPNPKVKNSICARGLGVRVYFWGFSRLVLLIRFIWVQIEIMA